MEYFYNFKISSYVDVFKLLGLPFLVLLSFLIIVFVNLYRVIRRKFPISVNCWFCNRWSKVAYEDYNCFICPLCDQYNGFNKNGDYNKPLPQMSDRLLNNQNTAINKTANLNTNNGLCQFCNNHLQLKIHQLAHFVPLYEDNYDIEIEHFRQQLEKAYKLCSKCENVVNKKIRHQNSLLGLNISNLKLKGVIPFLNFETVYSLTKPTKFRFFLVIIQIGLLILTFLNSLIAFKDLQRHKEVRDFLHPFSIKIHYLRDYTSNLTTQIELPQFLLHFYKLHLIKLAYIPNICLDFNRISVIYLLTIGMSLQLSTLFWKIKRNSKTLINIFGLFVLICLCNIYNQNIRLDLLKVCISTVVFITTLISFWNKNDNIIKKKRFKKLNKNAGKESSTLEKSDFNKSDSFAKPDISFKNPPLNYSFRGFENQAFSPRICSNLNSTSVFENSLRNRLNTSRNTIKNSSSEESLLSTKSINNSRNCSNTDLNKCLNNLTLGNSNFVGNRSCTTSPFDHKTASFSVNNFINRPKPIISPSKFQNPIQNSWVPGGFWRNEDDGGKFPFCHPTRSPSRSFGFYSCPPSVNNSACGDYDNYSVTSEPLYSYVSKKGAENQRNGFVKWNRSPENQLNASLGEESEPVMISESLFRTMPTNFSYPHFEHVYTNFYSNPFKNYQMKGNDLMYPKAPYDDYIPDVSVRNTTSSHKSNYF